MNVYTCNKFTGHYPVGVAAVVTADSEQEAAGLLNAELKARGLEGDAKPEHMMRLFRFTAGVRILNDGDY